MSDTSGDTSTEGRTWIPVCMLNAVDGEHCSWGGILPAIHGASLCENHSKQTWQLANR